MVPAAGTIECLIVPIAVRRGRYTIKSLVAAEAQLEAFETYLLTSKKSARRS